MKKYVKSYEEYDDGIDGINLGEADFYDDALLNPDLIDDDDGTINPEESKYYDKMFKVLLWSGAGYGLNLFYVNASYPEEALEKVVAFCEKYNCYEVLIDPDTVLENGYSDDDLVEQFIYVDATLEGASKPYYVYAENFRIEEV